MLHWCQYIIATSLKSIKSTWFQQTFNNFVSFELLLTKLSGIDPYEKLIDHVVATQVGMLEDMFLWLVENLKQGVIYFIKQACGSDILASV